MRYTLPGLLIITACGSPMMGGNGDDTGSNGNDDAAVMNMADAFVPPTGYTKLIGRTWTIGPGAFDEYKCVRVTIPSDTYITNIMAQAPSGTHHTVLSIAGGNNTTGPDGEQDCGVSTLGMQMLYASGVGTSPLDFPADVGVKIAAGTQIHLNLHLFNAGDENLSGDSGIYVKMQSTPPAQIAEMVFAGTFAIFLQPSPMERSVTRTCTLPTGFNLFAVWPHMHQLATKQKVEHIRGSGGSAVTTVLHDMPYDFEEQKYYLKSPIFNVQSGDQLKVTCTYLNNTGQTVTFGDGSNQEMCFAGLYRYPALNEGLFQCSENPNF